MLLDKRRYHDDFPIREEDIRRRWPTDDQFDGDPDYPLVPFDPMLLERLFLDSEAATINVIDPYSEDLRLKQDLIRTLMQRQELDI